MTIRQDVIDSYRFGWAPSALFVDPNFHQGRWFNEAEALELGIKKWAFIETIPEGAKLSCGGTYTCALCHLHHSNCKDIAGVDSCKTCPVMRVTDQQFCQGTPFALWMSGAPLDESGPSPAEIARLEGEFLKSLRKGV